MEVSQISGRKQIIIELTTLKVQILDKGDGFLDIFSGARFLESPRPPQKISIQPHTFALIDSKATAKGELVCARAPLAIPLDA